MRDLEIYMSEKYEEPKYKLEAFNCPHCGAFAHQKWYRLYQDKMKSLNLPNYNRNEKVGASSGYVVMGDVRAPSTMISSRANPVVKIDDLSLSRCDKCNDFCVWLKDRKIYPTSYSAPLPDIEMPDDVKDDFLEARKVVELSPRSSAALLRLALQKLMKHLGCEGKDINYDIKKLVDKGLPIKIQQSLDLVRVIGNESVHPGTIDLKDDKETAITLFKLLNLIIYDRITQPKEIDALYNKLPPSKLNGISDRNKKK